MDLTFSRCAGIDVHKRMLMVCIRIVIGGKLHTEVREFGTMTKDLLALVDWLLESGVTHVAMESTGSYWKPVYNILEGSLEIFVVNAHHVKQVPGRKTDVKDSQWLAQLMAYGLLKPSFVPTTEQRALRDLTRSRTSFVTERSRLCNRIQKLLEESNVKLASVATDVLGVSGRNMLRELAGGNQDVDAIAELAKGRLRNKIQELKPALEGRMKSHQRFLLGELLAQVEALDATIRRIEGRIGLEVESSEGAPFESAIRVLTSIDGVDENGAKAVLGEIGVDMHRFGSANRIGAWSGLAPGNSQSGGKRLSGKTLPGNKNLKRVMIQIARAAVKKKGTYLAALYGRLSARRGKKKAIVAVAHSILRSMYYMLLSGEPYKDLGADHFDKRNQQNVLKSLTKRLDHLGYQVVPKEAAVA